jgi:hypothetical protein
MELVSYHLPFIVHSVIKIHHKIFKLLTIPPKLIEQELILFYSQNKIHK